MKATLPTLLAALICAACVPVTAPQDTPVETRPTTPGPAPSGTLYVNVNAPTGVQTFTTSTLEIELNDDGDAVEIRGQSGAASLDQAAQSMSLFSGALSLDNHSEVLPADEPNTRQFIDPFVGSEITIGEGIYSTPLSGTYEFIVPFFAVGRDVNFPNNVNGQIGWMGRGTRSNDMPVRGLANYRGEGGVSISPNLFEGDPNTESYAGGTASVNVDFTAGRVDVTLSDFAEIVDDDDRPLPSPTADTFTVTGMRIDRNTFSGGTVSAQLNGDDVRLLGNAQTVATAGGFFGYDESIGAPDEVASVTFASGNGLEAEVSFIAD